MNTYLKYTLATVLMLSSFAVAAQSQNDQPVWRTSKEVQKVSNEKLFTSEELKASHVESTSEGIPSVAVSKQVQATTNERVNNNAKGNVKSGGYPAWIISKKVQRLNR